jgi:3-dehydrotetronate 4-kinase
VSSVTRPTRVSLADLPGRFSRRGVGRLVIAGGEASGAIIDALGISRLTVARFTSPGLCATTPKPLSLCLKSGKLGAVDLFATALEKLRKAA